ncbi:uncharacterized protein LOC125044037 [Penaeus chinensis]|uniref:uncharacterized protein LOC125044037 n=1 Tax=Penaeus chinensis TaxID=139456 RepID=UPI001FB85A4B|nr:uncharacterized protein LOC125044037 [Penaeus chinensis]
MHALVISIFLHACETWTLTAELDRKIQAVEMRCYTRILGFSYRVYATNEEVRKIIPDRIGPQQELLSTFRRRKLQWYGHVTRSSGLAKTILQGTVKSDRRRGGQKKKWIDHIKEWTGAGFATTRVQAKDQFVPDFIAKDIVISRFIF